jgi:hypothetical protein
MDVLTFEYYDLLSVPKKDDATKPGTVYDHFGLFRRSSAMRRNRRMIGFSVDVAGSQGVAYTNKVNRTYHGGRETSLDFYTTD